VALLSTDVQRLHTVLQQQQQQQQQAQAQHTA
jgi:hypothetical protein